MPISPYGFRLGDIAPDTDPVFVGSAPARRAYWQHLGQEGKTRFARRILQGRDRFGQRVTDIGPEAREHRAQNRNWKTGHGPYSPMGRADPKAPPLAPNYERSRVIALFDFALIEDGHALWFYWRRDPHTGKDWGQIMGYHRTGYTVRMYRGWRRVPARDEIGFPAQDVQDLARLGARWWQANRRRWETAATRAPTLTAAGPRRPQPAPTLRGAVVPPTPAGAIGASRRGLFGRVGSAVGRAAGKVVGKLFGGFLHGA